MNRGFFRISALLLILLLAAGCAASAIPSAEPPFSGESGSTPSAEPSPQDSTLPPTTQPPELYRRFAGLPENSGWAESYHGHYDGAKVYSFYHPGWPEAPTAMAEETIGSLTFRAPEGEPYPLALYVTQGTQIYTLADAFSQGVLSPDSLAVLHERLGEYFPQYYSVQPDPDRERIQGILEAVGPELDTFSLPDAVPAFMQMRVYGQGQGFAGYDLQALEEKYGEHYEGALSPGADFESGARNIFGPDVTVLHRDMPPVFYYDAQLNVYTTVATGGRRSPRPYITQIAPNGDEIIATAFFLNYSGEYETYTIYQDEDGGPLGELPNGLPLTYSQALAADGQYGFIRRDYIFTRYQGRLILKEVRHATGYQGPRCVAEREP